MLRGVQLHKKFDGHCDVLRCHGQKRHLDDQDMFEHVVIVVLNHQLQSYSD